MVARDGVVTADASLFRAAYYRLIPIIVQQLNFAEWPQFCDHSVTSADVRLSVGLTLDIRNRDKFLILKRKLETCSHIEYNCSLNEYSDRSGGSSIRAYERSHPSPALWLRRSDHLYTPDRTGSGCQYWRGSTRA